MTAADVLSAHAGHSHGHALHLGFAIFCVLVVVVCVLAAKFTGPKAPSRAGGPAVKPGLPAARPPW